MRGLGRDAGGLVLEGWGVGVVGDLDGGAGDGGAFTTTRGWGNMNVWAFIFGILWYLARGLWAKALIYGVILFGFGMALDAFGVPVMRVEYITGAVFMGFYANYDRYLLVRKGTQLWEGASYPKGSHPALMAGVLVVLHVVMAHLFA